MTELYGGGPTISFTVRDPEECTAEEPNKSAKKRADDGSEEEVEHHGEAPLLDDQFLTEPGICGPCKEQRDEMVHQQNLNYEEEWVVVLVPSTSRRGIGYALHSRTGRTSRHLAPSLRSRSAVAPMGLG